MPPHKWSILGDLPNLRPPSTPSGPKSPKSPGRSAPSLNCEPSIRVGLNAGSANFTLFRGVRPSAEPQQRDRQHGGTGGQTEALEANVPSTTSAAAAITDTSAKTAAAAPSPATVIRQVW